MPKKKKNSRISIDSGKGKERTTMSRPEETAGSDQVVASLDNWEKVWEK